LNRGEPSLIRLWKPGDRIFLFGFSRGAYTIRCLAAVIAKCGIPTSDKDGGKLKLDVAIEPMPPPRRPKKKTPTFGRGLGTAKGRNKEILAAIWYASYEPSVHSEGGSPGRRRGGLQPFRCSSPGSLAKFVAMRRASSRVEIAVKKAN
jgi:type VI secretion system (T6SS) phospholipase Tle1-like effector